MIAYNKQHLEETFLALEAESLTSSGFVAEEQKNLAEEKLLFYQMQNNVFLKSALFALGSILFIACCLLFGVIFISGGDKMFKVFFFICAGFGVFVIEFAIREKKYFAYGIDDAFLFCTQLSLAIAVGILIDNEDYLFPLHLTITLAGIFCCVRYVDSLSALIACVGLATMIGDLLLEAGTIGQSLLPFVMMLLAFGIYKFSLGLKVADYYSKSLKICYAFSLFLFYAAGNYLIVRQATEELLNQVIASGDDISLAWFFYAFTFIVPVMYIVGSLFKKDRWMLWMGVLSLAFSIYTIRYYYHVLPVEWALILGGSILFILAFFSIRKLTGKTTGLTFEPDKFGSSNQDALNMEILIVAEKFAVKPTEDINTEFGGGKFGGGGAESNF